MSIRVSWFSLCLILKELDFGVRSVYTKMDYYLCVPLAVLWSMVLFFFFSFFSSGSSNEDTSVSLAPQISLRTEWSTNSACLTCSKSAANSSTSWASVVF